MVVIRGEDVGKIGRCLSKFIKLNLGEMNEYRDSVYTMTTVAKKYCISYGKLSKRVDFMYFHYTEKILTL